MKESEVKIATSCEVFQLNMTMKNDKIGNRSDRSSLDGVQYRSGFT